MKSQAIFQEEKERQRLAVQQRLLLSYEEPVFRHIFSGNAALRVLDIGCNDGRKTVERFSDAAVTKAIGLEYNEKLAEQAQSQFGGEKFTFYACNVEAEDFPEQLKAIMGQNQLEGFDVIYLSFLLMHLRDPERFLKALHSFLAPGGQLVVEANDGASTLSPRGHVLLKEFLEILKQDAYSGNREFGQFLPERLADWGYRDITLWHGEIAAGGGELEKKQDIFTTFFSYLEEDVRILHTVAAVTSREIPEIRV